MPNIWKYFFIFIQGLGLVLIIITIFKIKKLKKEIDELEGEILTNDLSSKILNISRLGIAGTLLNAIPALIRIFIW